MLDKLIRDLPEDDYDAVEYLINHFGVMNHELGDQFDEDLFGFYCLFQRAIERGDLGLKLDFGLSGTASMVVDKKIKSLIAQIKPRLIFIRVEKLLEMRKAGKIISDDMVVTIQSRVDDLRKTLLASDVFSEEHKSRLLSRLERLQQELHKKDPDLDVLFSHAAKLCVVIENLGKSSKPLSDNVVNILDSARKLVQQIWGISPDLPALPSGQQTTLSIGSE